jgi:hypothetical protein
LSLAKDDENSNTIGGAESFAAGGSALLASDTGTRWAGRWSFLFRRKVDADLLPAELPSATTPAKKHFIFSHDARCGSARIPPLPAMQAE